MYRGIPCFRQTSFDRTNVLHRDGLTSAGVISDSQHHQRNFLGAVTRDDFREARNVHVSFEGVCARRLFRFGDRQVQGFRPGKFAVSPGCVEVRVVRNEVALLAHHVEEDALGGVALVRWNDVAKTEDACTESRNRMKLGEPA